VLYNSHQQGLIIERCWLIYELVSDKLVPPDEFHIRYPSLVEFALTSGYFRLLVEIVVFLGVCFVGFWGFGCWVRSRAKTPSRKEFIGPQYHLLELRGRQD